MIAGAVVVVRVTARRRGPDREELDRELQRLGEPQQSLGAGRASPFSNWLTAADVSAAWDATAARVSERDSRASRSRRAENSALAIVAASREGAAGAGWLPPGSWRIADGWPKKAGKSVIGTQIKHRRLSVGYVNMPPSPRLSP